MDFVLYDSRNESGTTKTFAQRLGKALGVKVLHIKEYEKLDSAGKYVLCTYTIGLGEVPKTTEDFLENYSENMLSVISNGSSNFISLGLYGRAGNLIAEKYGVNCIKKIDLGGTLEDVEYCAKRINILYGREQIVHEYKELSTYTNGIFKFKRLHI